MDALNYGPYIVCHEHLKDVKNFLLNFFDEVNNEYNHESWQTLRIPNSQFLVNVMKGNDQKLTQNMVFEIYCNSMEQLNKYAEKYKAKVESFLVTEVKDKYTYNYFQIPAPQNICKIEFSYIQK